MTKSRASRITGLEIVQMGEEWHALDEHGSSIARAIHHESKRALHDLVEAVYRIRSEQVRLRQGYKCLMCGRVSPLEIDHIKSRARGDRDDRLENLRGVCAGMTGCNFHSKRHGG